MKKKKLNKRLVLKKSTISSLDPEQMTKMHGGYQTIPGEPCTVYSVDVCPTKNSCNCGGGTTGYTCRNTCPYCRTSVGQHIC